MPGGASHNNTMPGGTDSQKAMKHSGKVQKTTEIVGLNVHNNQDESIGAVEDIVIDLASGRVVAVIVSSGGFLGMGESLNAVPPDKLQYGPEEETLRLDMTKEALREAPRFTAGEWPDFSDKNTTDGMNRAYQSRGMTGNQSATGALATTGSQSTQANRGMMENRPMTDARKGNPSVAADNSGRNVRDRDDRSLTSGDQGNSAGDIQITQRIRQAVVAHDDLSINAQNVKIVTVDGRVTLRGPVASAEEKKAIGEIANRVASGRVDNQLEVATR